MGRFHQLAAILGLILVGLAVHADLDERVAPLGLEPATHFGPTLLDHMFLTPEGAVFSIGQTFKQAVVLHLYWRSEGEPGVALRLNGGASFLKGEQIRVNLEEFRGRKTWAVYVVAHGKEDIYYARLGRDASHAVYRFPYTGEWMFLALGIRQTATGAVLDIYRRENQKIPSYSALVAPSRGDTDLLEMYIEDMRTDSTIREVSEIRISNSFIPTLPQLTPLNHHAIP